jgi:hypothetical protein
MEICTVGGYEGSVKYDWINLAERSYMTRDYICRRSSFKEAKSSNSFYSRFRKLSNSKRFGLDKLGWTDKVYEL